MTSSCLHLSLNQLSCDSQLLALVRKNESLNNRRGALKRDLNELEVDY